jgi:hypothetical protein
MLLGADPEFFLVNDKYEIVNAISILPYCKKKPLKEKNFSFFYDNILAECRGHGFFLWQNRSI